jgi:aspartate/methionine/tyrosine aminotransferase
MNVIEAIAGFACEHDLRVFSDEVYEDYVYGPDPLPRVDSIPGLEERTLRFFSFSKAYAMAGNRVGYVTGPKEVIDVVERYTTFAVYSVSGEVSCRRTRPSNRGRLAGRGKGSLQAGR